MFLNRICKYFIKFRTAKYKIVSSRHQILAQNSPVIEFGCIPPTKKVTVGKNLFVTLLISAMK